MSQNNQLGNTPLNQEYEISLLDILLFLKRSWKIIAIFGVIGLATAVVYLLTVPKRYEAVAQIQMAQINNTPNSTSIQGVNIEEPALLIARMSSYAPFTSSTLTACGLDEKKNVTNNSAQSIKFSQLKGLPNIVELKTTASNPELAEQCANAIFELVKTSQEKIVSPFIAEAKIRLADNQEQLAKARDIILRAEKSGLVMSAVYLLTRDEIQYMINEIAISKNIIASGINGVTRLVAPITVRDNPIFPKKQVILIISLLGGLFLGLLIALLGQMIPKLRKQLANNLDKT